jgi:hypothetical protein
VSGSEKWNNIPTYLPTQKNLSRIMANKQNIHVLSMHVSVLDLDILPWHLLGHAIMSVICFDLQFSCSTRPMTSFCIFIAFIFSKYFKIQFAWPTFQKRSWTVMTIMSTNRKNTNAWRIPSMDIHSVHKHRGNSFQRQNYKMRFKQKFELNKFHASKKDPFY